MNHRKKDTISSPPAANDLLAKRRRGRPRKGETSHANQKPADTDFLGKVVSGVVEASFEAGYVINVQVKDSDEKLRGLVFIPGKVNPITPANDVAPLAKMYKREEIKNQNDQPMKDAAAADAATADAATAVTDLVIYDPARALSLIPRESNSDAVQAPKEATCLVEFSPNPETMMMTRLNIGETSRGFDLMMAEKPVCEGEKVPAMLQLEFGNKTTFSGDNNGMGMETDPETYVSRSAFIASLFGGEDNEEDEDEATPSVQ